MRQLLLVLFLLTIAVPSPITAQDSCDGAPVLESRINRGSYGRVTIGGSANRVRAMPSTDSEVLFSMLPGQVFYVTEFPVCTDDIVWLFVDVNGRTGWTAESVADVGYFVEPLIGVQTIADTFTFDFGAASMAFSRDGRTLYAVERDGLIHIITLPEGTVSTQQLNTFETVIGFAVDHEDSGFVTIHERWVNVWNLNFDHIRRIDASEQMATVEVARVSPDWTWVVFGGCLTADADGCAVGAIEVVEIAGDQRVMVEYEGGAFVDMTFFMAFGLLGEPAVDRLVLATDSSGRGIAWDMVRECERWRVGVVPGERVYAIAVDLFELVVYGTCDVVEGDVCVTGGVHAYSWYSGGLRGTFLDFDGPVTEVLLSPLSTARHRIAALVAGQDITLMDYDAYNDEPVITTLDTIAPQTMALSPDGAVLAAASSDRLVLYDVSVMGQ